MIGRAISKINPSRFAKAAALACAISMSGADASPAPARAGATLPESAAAQALSWRLVGPFRGGRTRAVAGIARGAGHSEIFLVGAVNGGVWKTGDYGRTWEPIFDSQPTQSIGAIAVASSNPNVIYVGSGEGLHRPDLSVGDGIYRSTDAGKNWTHLGLRDAQQIPDLAVDPKDENRLFAAVLGHPFGPSSERGIYRSVDGGRSFTRVLYRDENTGGSSVKLDPGDPRIVYASLWNVRSGPWEDENVYNGTAGGLFKSTDGGDHWRPLKNGLPDNLAQIEVAVAPNKPGRLYASVATSAPGEYSSAAGLGIFRSDDSGESWTRVTTDPRPALRIGGGDLPILKVDPTDADIVYSASIVAMKSVDAGVHWSPLRGAPGGDDYQNLWINPENPRHIALVADQGALITLNGGSTWSSWFNQPTAQLYHIGVTPTFPYRVCSGQQESGSVCISSRGNDGRITMSDWHPVGVIEYGYVAPDPLDADIIYGAGRNVVTKTHLSTGQVQDVSPLPLRGPEVRVDRTEPIFFSPQDPHRLYYAANRLYTSIDAGATWAAVSPDLSRENPGVPPSVGDQLLPKAAKQRGAIYAASASALQAGLLWVGTDDGLIWQTANDGKDWRNVTPAALTAWSKVTQIEASHFDPQEAFASVSRFRIDDMKPYVYRTRDGGQSWQLVTAGLPADASVNTIREDPVRPGLLYAGTENAVWYSLDDGDHWHSLQRNLPHTSMRDLLVHDADLVLATHGRSFWILDDLSPLRQFSPAFAKQAAVLLKPAIAVRVQRSTGTDTPIPPDEPAGSNPPSGAIIDYYLSKTATQGVTLEILDSSGALVRRVASTDAVQFTMEDRERELIPDYWIRPPRPPGTATGMHRWVWDMHGPTPRTALRAFPISAVPGDTPPEPLGPVAVPGEYRVRLVIGEHRWEQPLTLVPDPRVRAIPGDYDAQLVLSKRLAAALDASTSALLEARSLRAQLVALKPAAVSALESRVNALEKAVTAFIEPSTGSPPNPRGVEAVNGDLATLYAQVNSADTAPTAAQTRAADGTVSEWQALGAAWQRLHAEDLSRLNLALRNRHLPLLRPELAPPDDADMADAE